MTATLSKVPTVQRPLIQDKDSLAVIETLLEPYTGKVLERKQDIVRRFVASSFQGPFDQWKAELTRQVRAGDPKEEHDG